MLMAVSLPNVGLGLTVKLTTAVSLHPTELVTINWYAPWAETAEGLATALLLNVQLLVRLVVE